MINPIKQIYDFNEKAGLLEKGYDDFLESSFQIEEALEGLKDLPYLTQRLHPDQEFYEENCNPKSISRQIVKLAMMDNKTPLANVDRLDKACDAIVFAVGSMAKLGLNPQEITKALNIVMSANMAKLGCKKDEHGKLMKPDNFDELYAPEPKLRKLLESAGITDE
jgi:predicted HAD superfamily Cof-like phosphohydrolase